jgi:hypothetical protein
MQRRRNLRPSGRGGCQGLYDPTAVPGQNGYQALSWTVRDNVSVTANTTTTIAVPSGTTSNSVH